MALTRELLRTAYRIDQARRATSNPARFARNRAKSQALKAAGFYRLMGRFWKS